MKAMFDERKSPFTGAFSFCSIPSASPAHPSYLPLWPAPLGRAYLQPVSGTQTPGGPPSPDAAGLGLSFSVVFVKAKFNLGSFSGGYGGIKGIELAKMFLYPVHLDLSDPFIPPLFKPYT